MPILVLLSQNAQSDEKTDPWPLNYNVASGSLESELSFSRTNCLTRLSSLVYPGVWDHSVPSHRPTACQGYRVWPLVETSTFQYFEVFVCE